jgi:hypothetical protein
MKASRTGYYSGLFCVYSAHILFHDSLVRREYVSFTHSPSGYITEVRVAEIMCIVWELANEG